MTTSHCRLEGSSARLGVQWTAPALGVSAEEAGKELAALSGPHIPPQRLHKPHSSLRPALSEQRGLTLLLICCAAGSKCSLEKWFFLSLYHKELQTSTLFILNNSQMTCCLPQKDIFLWIISRRLHKWFSGDALIHVQSDTKKNTFLEGFVMYKALFTDIIAFVGKLLSFSKLYFLYVCKQCHKCLML